MFTTRRKFMAEAALGAASVAAGPLLRRDEALAAKLALPDATDERIAAAGGSFWRPYRSKSSDSAQVTSWVQIDLGRTQIIDAVKLYPAIISLRGRGFPQRFRIECADDLDLASARLITDQCKSDYPDPEERVLQFPAKNTQGRYVRLTVTQLQAPKRWIEDPSDFSETERKAVEQFESSSDRAPTFFFAVAKIEILCGGRDVAVGCPVTVDDVFGNPEDARQLTRPPRPQGEDVITDNPRNVTAPDIWRAVPDRARAPRTGIVLGEGLFLTALKNNIGYLLDSYSVDDLLWKFRQRAGKRVSAPATYPRDLLSVFWESMLAGSNAGRFMMGAANTLRWLEHDELRARLNAVVDGIAECRQPNGYIMAYPEDTFFVSERGAYTRSWVTHGLIEAGFTGNPKAFELLRGYYDWYNNMPYLAQALRRCGFGPQGMVANSRMYFTPVGKPADIQVLQRYFQENYWMEDLAARKPKAFWQYPYDRPHSYQITFVEAYLDLYRATGDRRYLEAVLGGWELIRENWMYPGGGIALTEHVDCPPKAYPLYERYNETCGNAFWSLLNQRLHQIEPEEEKYIAEIEKSIYNVLLPNQGGTTGIRYHAFLVGRKDKPSRINTCCEGQGTRLLGMLPQFIYSIAEDGLYVNLFEPSTLTCQQAGQDVRLEMRTLFPKDPQVRLALQCGQPVKMKLRIRVPSWATGSMSIEVNGEKAATGTPGRYATLERRWVSGDAVTFALPIGFKLTKYTGVDQIAGRERFALEYGPILMAALGKADSYIAVAPQELIGKLRLSKDKPLRFELLTAFAFLEATTFVPYYEIDTESFSCFPIIRPY